MTHVCGPQCGKQRRTQKVLEYQKRVRADARKWRMQQIQQNTIKNDKSDA